MTVDHRSPGAGPTQNGWLGTAAPPAHERDMLSNLLAALKLVESGLCVFDFRGKWSVEIADLALSFSWTVMEGTVWMMSAGKEAIPFRRGDTFLLPRGTCQKTYVFGSSPDPKQRSAPLRPQDIAHYSRSQGFASPIGASRPLSITWGSGGEELTRVVSIPFVFSARQLDALVAALPEFLIVRPIKADAEFIESLLQLLVRDIDTNSPGFAALAASTAQLLLTYIVRSHALSAEGFKTGALAGLADPRIARALACIHGEPERDWTVAVLARAAGLSRSSFAERFLALVGQTPMQHLRAWRMHLAREALTSGNTTITALTQKLGYQSEAAFRAAFRRITGQSPRDFKSAGTQRRSGQASKLNS